MLHRPLWFRPAQMSQKIAEMNDLRDRSVAHREMNLLERRWPHEQARVARKPYPFFRYAQHGVDTGIAILVMQDEQRIIALCQIGKAHTPRPISIGAQAASGGVFLAFREIARLTRKAQAQQPARRTKPLDRNGNFTRRRA